MAVVAPARQNRLLSAITGSGGQPSAHRLSGGGSGAAPAASAGAVRLVRGGVYDAEFAVSNSIDIVGEGGDAAPVLDAKEDEELEEEVRLCVSVCVCVWGRA